LIQITNWNALQWSGCIAVNTLSDNRMCSRGDGHTLRRCYWAWTLLWHENCMRRRQCRAVEKYTSIKCKSCHGSV